MGCMGGAPDTSAQDALAAQNSQLSKDSLAFAKTKYADDKATAAEYDPLYKGLIQSSLDASKLSAQQSAEMMQQYETFFKPAEAKMSDQAMNYDTPARREAAAAQARGDVNISAAQGQQANDMALARAGIAPGDPKYQALQQEATLGTTVAGAGAATMARRNVEATGLSLVDNLAKFGRGLTSSSLSASQLASGQGAQAVGTIGASQASMAAPGQQMLGAYGQAAGINSGAAQIYANSTAAKTQADAANSAGIGQLVGTVGTIGAIAF
jgi:hypothetical protein